MSSKNKRFQRKDSTRQPLSTALVVCEGDTERLYVEALVKRFNINPRRLKVLKAKHSDAQHIVENAKSQKEKESEKGNHYDQVFVIFDKDENDVEKVRNNAKKDNIQTIVSAPCFEYWILLHYELTDRAYVKCAQVVRDVKEFCHNHEKTNSAFYQEIINKHLGAAKRNARLINADSSSYTDMPILIDHLEKMKKERSIP